MRIRLGMLTPSSNTVLEPVTHAIVDELPGVSAHFSRFKVTEISLSEGGLAQFESAPFMTAADLLADAKMDVIAWNGTSAAWRGFHEDEALVKIIGSRFGAKATASMIALNDILVEREQKRFALVTPYIDEVQAKIIENYRGAGFDVADERHLGVHVNFDFALIERDAIAEMVRAVAPSRPDAIMIVCTNLNAAPLVAELEAEVGIPIYDSTSAVVWRALQLAGVDARGLGRWGSLFGSRPV